MYWIKGNKVQPGVIISILENVGGKNTQRLNGDDESAVYFIGRSGEIEKTNNPDLAWIIMQSLNAITR